MSGLSSENATGVDELDQLARMPTYEEFVSGTPVTGRVAEISQFSFTIFYQENGTLTSPAATSDILAGGLRSLNDVLSSTGIHLLHYVETSSQQPEYDGARLDG